jgi:hypothetical protein
MATRKRAVNRSVFLGALLQTGYFPRELPPVFTARHFAEHCEKDYKWADQLPATALRRWTKYETISAPKPSGGRRNLALVHPVSQLALSLLITEHRKKISNIVAGTNVSLYSTAENIKEFKAFDGLQFRARDERLFELCSKYDFVLRADISKFFYTLYTHSIPWSVAGKRTAKEWIRQNDEKRRTHWSSKLDLAVQCCQDGETVGIPVGPDTSRILSELVLAGIETDNDYLSVVKNQDRFRLLDDFAVGFDDEKSAEVAVSELRKALWKFNLQLNDEKTRVVESTRAVEDTWKLQFRNIKLSDKSVVSQRSYLYWLTDHSIKLCEEYNDGRPAIWGCRRFGQVRLLDENLEVLVVLLLRFAKDYPACIPHVAEFFINNQQKCQGKRVRGKVMQWIRSVVNSNADHFNDYEIAWSLVVAGVLKLEIDEKLVSHLGRVPSPLVFGILGMLRERGLLKVPLSHWPWRAEYNSLGVYEACWLPFYESVKRNWTTDKSLIRAVNSDQILKRLLNAGVSFMDDKVFDATRFDLRHRVYSVRKGYIDRPEGAKLLSSSKTSDGSEFMLDTLGY